MNPLSVPHPVAASVLQEQAAALEAAARSLSDLELLDPSRCRGWSRLDTVVHVRSGLDELLSAWSTRTSADVTHDAASYWSSHPDSRDDDPVPHVLWLRRTAAAYERPTRAVRHLIAVVERLHVALDTTAPGVAPGAAASAVAFQGKVLTSGDLLATWVVELTVHHLDLALDLDLVPEAAPTEAALDLTRRTVEAVSGGTLPAALDGAAAVLVALGRVPWPHDVPRVPHLPVSL